MPEYCPSCGVGILTPTSRTYVHFYGATLVHAPNVRAWKCDICHLTLFDQGAVGRIELMVGEAGPPPNVAAGPPVRPAEAPAADAAPREDLPDDPPRSAKP